LALLIGPMAQAMGLSDTSFEAFYAQVCALLDQLQIPVRLTEIGVDSDCAERIAAKALQDSAAETNPRALTVGAIERVVQVALENGR
jgi:alcohol dehydrogenase class IV